MTGENIGLLPSIGQAQWVLLARVPGCGPSACAAARVPPAGHGAGGPRRAGGCRSRPRTRACAHGRGGRRGANPRNLGCLTTAPPGRRGLPAGALPTGPTGHPQPGPRRSLQASVCTVPATLAPRGYGTSGTGPAPPPRAPSRPAATTRRAWRPAPWGAAGRRAGGGRPVEQTSRRPAVCERLHRRGAPVPGLCQARHRLPHPARRRPGPPRVSPAAGRAGVVKDPRFPGFAPRPSGLP